MFLLKERLRQKYRTLNWPRLEPALSGRYRGRPLIVDVDCGECGACFAACPTGALLRNAGHAPSLDMGRCLFCGACEAACPQGAFAFSCDYHVAAFSRGELIVSPAASGASAGLEKEARPAQWRLFRRSLKLRQVSAGGCNACEADCNVLGTLVYDLGRFGIEFTASPRHADGLVVTGPVTRNMLAALLDTWHAVPGPKLLFAVGACAISGGLFAGGQCAGGFDGLAAMREQTGIQAIEAAGGIRPDVYIPGCPPNPWSILAGLLSIR